MDTQDKRAALFEYFKQANKPKWVANGDKLYTSLRSLPPEKVDAMYDRMIELRRRAELFKQAKEASKYKPWKMFLFQTLLTTACAIFLSFEPKPVAHFFAMFYMFVGGMWGGNLVTNLIYNYIQRKYSNKETK